MFATDGKQVTVKKLELPSDVYLESVSDTLGEWSSPEDEEAWRDL